MSSEIVVNGIHYIPSKEAAAKVGLVADYISRMCRGNLVDGKLVGGVWYVNESSLGNFLARQREEEALRRASQAQLLKEERGRADRSARRAARLRRVPHVVLLATTVAMLLGTAALSFTTSFPNTAPAVAAVASALPAPLRASLDRVATSVYNFVCPYFSDCNAHSTLVRATPGTASLSLTQHPATTSATTPPAPQQLPTRTTPTISQPTSPPAGGQPIIERVRETVHTIVQGGISEALLDARLLALTNDLNSRVNEVALAGAYQTNRTYDVLATALRIENLDDVNITNSTWTSGSIAAAAISGTLSNAISSALATISSLTATELVATNATTTNATTTNLYISGTATIGSGTGVLQSTTGVVSALANGSNGQVLKIVGGALVWSSDLTGGGGGGSSAWATTSDDLALYPADPADVVLIGTNATTTTGNILEVSGNSLLRGTLTAYNTVTAPIFTATSTSATSTFPRLNVSGSLGLGSDYLTDITGSGLSISSGALTLDTSGNWSGTLGSYSAPQLIAAGFATTSADAWKTNRNFFATSSADYWKSATDLFSTSSAAYHLGTLDKGFFFSTTSADVWKSERNFFSTTSADYFLAQNQGTAFSTTSAQHFIHSSSTIPKTYTANTFAALQTFGNASTSILSATTLCLSTDCRTSWPSAGSSFAYPFPNDATTTTLTFNGGLLSVGSTTINGNATTTGMLGVGSLFINNSRFTSLLGTGLTNSGGSLTLDTSGDWTGTFDGLEGAAYLANSFSTTSADVWKVNRSFFATTSADYFLTQKTTDNLTQGASNKYYSTLLFASDLAGTTTDALAQGSTNKYWSNTLFDTRLSATTSLPNITTLASLSLPATQLTNFGVPFYSFFSATNTNALAEGSTNKYFTDARADARINATSTIGTLTSAPNLSTIATSLSGFLKATAGVLSTALIDLANDVTGILAVTRGGTGWANIASAAIPYGNGAGALSTTTAGTPGQVLALLNGVPTWTATTTFASPLSYASGIVSLSTSGDWTGTLGGYNSSQLIALGFSTTSADVWKANRDFFATSSADYWKTTNNFFATTSAMYFVDASTTIPKTYTANTFGLLQTFGNASTSILSASTLCLSTDCRTSWPTAGSSFGYLFPSNATSTTLTFSNGLLALASSTIGNGTQSGGLTISGGATTTGALVVQGNATSTFAGGLQATALNITSTSATSTFANGLNLSAGCFSILGTCLSSGSSSQWTTSGSAIYYSAGNVGVGTTSPWGLLSVNPNGLASGAPAFVIGSSTATLFSVTRTGVGSVFNFGMSSTSTVPNNAAFAWTIATSTTAKPLFQIDTTAGSEGIAIGASDSDVVIGDVGAPSNLVFEESAVIKGQGSGRTITIGANSDIVNVAVNLGLGSTTPWKSLSVVGTVAINGLTGATGAGSLCLTPSKEVVYNSGSDACLSSTRATKHDIESLMLDGLSLVDQLQPVSFVYNDGDGRTRYGFIAEDTAALNQHLATYDAGGKVSGIDDRAILSVVVKAIKGLASKLSETALLVIDTLTAKLVRSDRVETTELCVKDICVTRDQFAAVFGAAAAGSLPTSVISPPSTIRELPTAEDPPISVSSTTQYQPLPANDNPTSNSARDAASGEQPAPSTPVVSDDPMDITDANDVTATPEPANDNPPASAEAI